MRSGEHSEVTNEFGFQQASSIWTCHSIDKTRDHISELPDDVLCTIISSNSLSIRDRVVATSLSSRWTRLCPHPYFHWCFDWDAMFSSPPNSSKCTILDKQDPCAYYRNVRPCTWQCKTDTKRFVEGVSQFLETYKAKPLHHPIKSFTVDFCLDEEYAEHIDQWVKFAIDKGVKTLVLKLSCRESPVYVESGYCYTFDCPIPKSNVERLELKSCKLTINAISHFSSLTSLHLTGVALDQALLHAVSQHCSNLKSLALYHCTLPFQSRISSKFIDTLVVHFCAVHPTERITISGANLTKFEFSGMINTFSFSGVPNLRSVFLKVKVGMTHDQDMHYVFTQLANDLPSGVQVLGLDVKHAPKPSALAAGIVTFKVKELNLTFRQWRVRFDMLEVIHILRAFPVLQKFKLQICCPQDIEEPTGGAGEVVENTHLNYLEEVEIRGFHEEPTGGAGEVVENTHLNHLEEVEIRRFCATQNQIDFAIYLLKFGISLKRLFIDPKIQITEVLDVKMKRVSWDEGEREEVCQELQHLFQEDKEVIIAP